MKWLIGAVLASAFALADTTVVLKTNLGEIEIRVDETQAPATAANFLKYVRAGAYENGIFHRTVTLQNQPQNKIRIQVIQGGKRPDAAEYPPVKLERTNVTGLKHKDGAVSMARDAADTATSDFFICIGDQPELDFGGKRNPDGQGFAAFGKVTRGMEVVRAIQSAAAEGQTLKPPITILNARIVK